MSSPPTTLGKYQIIREIARSNDIVYEAYDPLMNRRVALKELAMPGGSTDQQKQDRIKRFLREAKAAGSLSHPNIMTVYEVGEEAARHFIAMEFLDGHTLRNEIDTHGAMAPARAVEIALEVLAGLEFAHKSGVVHRDIKPDNIQLLSDGRVKLTDFGIARLTFEPNLTMDGQVFGTPSYMSPEQVVGKDIDARSDLFSLGIVLYEMLTGVKPFTGDSVVSITYAIMNKEPDQPPGVGWALWQAISRALDKSPALRPSSAKEMAEELTRAIEAAGNVVQDAPPAPSPYGPPIANPYATPVAYPQAPPPTYPYNPYQLPTPGGHTTLPPGFMMPLPNYYPPPRKPPLLRPATKRLLGRVFVVSMMLSALFALVVAGVWSASRVYQRMHDASHDKRIKSSLRSMNSNLPLSERIARTQSALSQMKGEEEIAQVRRELSDLYRKQAAALARSGEDGAAQQALNAAIASDPENAGLYEALGDFYYSSAPRAPDPGIRRERYREASLKYEESLNKETALARRDDLSDKQAEASYQAAWLSYQIGDGAGFIYDIDRAAGAVRDPRLEARISRLRDQAQSAGF